MSSFGCKSPMRNDIMSQDRWFPDADMINFLKDHFEKKDDNTKAYYFVDKNHTAALRRKPCHEYIVKGCRKFHLIAVNPKGELITIKHYNDENISNLNFSFDCSNISEEYTPELTAEEDCVQNFEQNPHKLFHVIEPFTFFSLLSPSNSIELFFLAEVLDKGKA